MKLLPVSSSITRWRAGRRFTLALAVATLAAAPACKQQKSKLDPILSRATPTKAEAGGGTTVTVDATAEEIDSKDILGRKDTSENVMVKHVLISWKELASVYGGRQDPRAKDRTNADAAKLARDLLAKLQANPDAIHDLVKEHSEDPGSAQSGEPYEITPTTKFVPEFKDLSLRLRLNEAGIVKTSYGYHVIMRVPPPPPDPLESADILGRTDVTPGTVQVQHVLIGWKDAPMARGATRSKAEADALAQEVLGKVRAGGDMAALMKQYSEDPGSKDNARAYDVSADAAMVEPFKKLSMRLKVSEAGLVKSPFGWHVIKRVPPPPPDPLESAAILDREPVTKVAKVKHILLGWTEVHADDERGKKRTRAELDKLVKATIAKLNAGAKIEPLMAELSEDPGSAKDGKPYDVSPDAALVDPFKNLSLRLNVNEVGAVKTTFGIHIIKRVE